MRQLITTRNVTGDMKAQIERQLELAGDTWIPAAVAVALVERLAEEDPELLSKWLEANAVGVVRAAIVDLERSKRSQARLGAKREPSVFTKALSQYDEERRPEILAAWMDTTFVVSASNARKRLADMERQDLLFASDRYTQLSRSHAMQAAFLRVLADRVGARQVKDVIDEDQLAQVWVDLDT